MGCSYRWNEGAENKYRMLWLLGLLRRRLEVNFRDGSSEKIYGDIDWSEPVPVRC
jgi:hypothetical protein